MDKLWLFRTLIITLLICLLAWDGPRLLIAGSPASVPPQHRQILLTGAVLWLATLFLIKNSDDDWAGEL